MPFVFELYTVYKYLTFFKLIIEFIQCYFNLAQILLRRIMTWVCGGIL
jgi:hypothetical protein